MKAKLPVMLFSFSIFAYKKIAKHQLAKKKLHHFYGSWEIHHFIAHSRSRIETQVWCASNFKWIYIVKWSIILDNIHYHNWLRVLEYICFSLILTADFNLIFHNFRYTGPNFVFAWGPKFPIPFCIYIYIYIWSYSFFHHQPTIICIILQT